MQEQCDGQQVGTAAGTDMPPVFTIEKLRDIAYAIVGTPDEIKCKDRVVGIIEARDGTIMDVVRQIDDTL